MWIFLKKQMDLPEIWFTFQINNFLIQKSE